MTDITAKSPRSKKDKKEKKEKTLTQSTLEQPTITTLTNHQISFKDCELAQVTVFSDRAEMTRKVSLELAEGIKI